MVMSNSKLDGINSGISSSLRDIQANEKNKAQASLTPEEKSKQEIDKHEKMFLNLLATELKNQTPDKPVDSGQMMQQIAQITQLRTTLQLNSKVEEIKNAISSSSNLLNASMVVGKNVVHEGDIVTVGENAKSIPIYYKPEQVMVGHKIELVVLDKKGETLYSKDLSKYQVGTINSFTWDGKDAMGRKLPEGEYKFVVRAKNDKELKAKVYTSTLVKQAMTDGSLWLVDGRHIPLNQIYGISDAEHKGILHGIPADIGGSHLYDSALTSNYVKSQLLEQAKQTIDSEHNIPGIDPKGGIGGQKITKEQVAALNMAELGKLVDQIS